MICEDNTSRSFTDLSNVWLADKHDLIMLCSNIEHMVCQECFVQSFISTGFLPHCVGCSEEHGQVDVIPFRKVLPVLDAYYGKEKEEADYGDLEDEVTEELLVDLEDEYEEEHPFVIELAKKYMLHEHSTRVDFCACHSAAPLNRGTVCMEPQNQRQIVRYDPNILFGYVNINQEQVFLPHHDVCNHCLYAHPEGTDCFISEYTLNTSFRHVSAPGSHHGMYRNRDISMFKLGTFMEFVLKPNGPLHTLCPCGQELHKTEKCNELVCPSCRMTVCNICWHAEYHPGKPMIDHFGPQKCPRYDNDVTLFGEECPCTPACQSHEKGDCTLKEHESWKYKYKLLRQTRIVQNFIQNLSGQKKRRALELETLLYK
jgi:hypothetical protein